MVFHNSYLLRLFVRLSLLSLLFFISLLLLLFVPGFSAFAQDAPAKFFVHEVEIEGNRRIDTAAIRLQLDVFSGEIDSGIVSEEIRKIYRTGFFDQVSASLLTLDTTPPINVLRYTVVEKPVVRRSFIVGNKDIRESDLREVLRFEGRRFFDSTRVQRLMQQAEALYQSRGYFDASFDYTTEAVDDGLVDVTFRVDEGERYRIREISIRGLRNLRESDVISVMQTSRYRWWSSWLLGTGRLNMEMVENDRALIRQFLYDNGYLDGTVSEPTIDRDNERLIIYFDVTEGAQYTLSSVGAAGDLIDDSVEKTLEGVRLSAGDVFNASQVREESFRISDKFSDIGYAFANVIPQTDVDPRANTVGITFVTEKANPVIVNRINIRGNEKSLDNVIRRELTIQERELYSGSKIRRSQQLLERLGFFEEVNISSEPRDRDDEIDLLVNVREGPTGSFSIGAGYSSADGPLFNTRLAETNFMGTGRSVSLDLDVGTERDSQILSIHDPRFNDTHLALGGDLLRTVRQFRDFDRRLAGGSLTTGYPLERFLGEWAQDISGYLKYEYLSIDIRNVNEENAAQLVIDAQGKSTASGFTPRLVRNTIDNPLNPSRGSRQDVATEITGLGGNEQYYLVTGRNQFYHPLLETDWGNLVFSWRTRVGYGETFNNEPLPLFRRFFPGGIDSVRGFRNRTLGPRDERGNEFGGSKELVNNLELIFPLVRAAGLNGVVFYDVGEAFDDRESIRLRELRQAWGYGLRWMSPLGPIRIEFGFPIDRMEGESSMVTLFSFGAPF